MKPCVCWRPQVRRSCRTRGLHRVPRLARTPVTTAHVAGRARHGARAARVEGVDAVARQALANGNVFLQLAHPATVNGGAGLVIAREGRTIGVVGMTVVDDRIVEIDLVTDPAKLP